MYILPDRLSPGRVHASIRLVCFKIGFRTGNPVAEMLSVKSSNRLANVHAFYPKPDIHTRRVRQSGIES